MFSASRKRKMSSVKTFGVNEKGVYQLCDINEILFQIGTFLRKMWKGCHSRENCKVCKDYSFVLEELERDRFGKREKKRFVAYLQRHN